MNSIRFELIHDIDRAQEFWHLFSPQSTLFQSWDFRYCFYKYFNYELFFYVGYAGDEPIGLLPLQFNSNENYLEFFGGEFMDDNQLFIKKGYEKYVNTFYNHLDRPHHLTYITGEDAFTKNLPLEEYKYILPLTGLANSDDYIEQYFHGESKKKLRKKIKKISELPIRILSNRFQDMDMLIDLNKKKFGLTSSFNKPHRTLIFHDLLKGPFTPHMLTFIIEEFVVAIAFALIFNNSYISLNSGISLEAPKDFATFIRIKKIDEAIKKHLHTYDFLSGDCGWKESWHFIRKPQYVFKKSL